MFTTGVAASSAPTLASPSNGATGIWTSPTLSWNPSTGATSYRLQVSANSSFSTTVLDQSNITSTSCLVTGLATNTVYYWQVNATSAGGTSSYSTSWSFTTIPSAGTLSGTWTVEQGTRLTNQTSSCTIVLPDGTYRSYLNSGKMSTSTDGVTWTTPVACVGIDATNAWNASVIYFNNKYMLIYEKQTTESGVSVRRLHRATSSDGLNFTVTTGSQTSGSIMSPQASDHNFLSVPDMISLNSTTIRMYFVAGGLWIETATSTNEGLTWTREGSITLTGLVQGLPSVDPDIVRLDDGRYQLFFTTNPDNQPGNALISTRIRSGLSSDGKTFTVDSGDRVSVDNSNLSRVDADVVKLSNGRYRMYFGEFNSSTPGAGATVNLRSALSGFLASPDDGASNVSINPTLTWNALSGVTSYRLQISTSSTFSSLVVDDSTVTATSRQAGPLANNTTYYWRVVANNGGGSSAYSETRSFTTTSASVTVSGTVNYGMTGGSPIRGVTVTLASLSSGNQAASTSDSSGVFMFSNVLPGTYSLTANKVGGFPAAYVNAADALRAALYPTNPSVISTSLAQLAADVNNDGTINAADALQIMLRYVGTVTSFAKGDWIFVPATAAITAGTSNITDNVAAIAVGDVNVDAVPSSGAFFAKVDGSKQSVVPVTGAVLRVNSVDLFEVPVRVKAAASIGSMSMAFQYPVESATFLGVRGPGGMVSAANNGVVAVAWFNAENALKLKENDAVVTLRFKPTANAKEFSLTLDPNSQVSDGQGSILSGINLESAVTILTYTS